MSEWVEIPVGIDLLKPDPNRSEGLHLSTIIYDLMVEAFPDKYKGDGNPLMMQPGLIWEGALAKELALQSTGHARIGEISKDGIACSPDAAVIEEDEQGNPEKIIEEYKFTWKSSREAPNHPKFDYWVIQLKAYCHVFGAAKGRIRAMFANGDYNRDWSKRILGETRAWERRFSQRELQENWDMIVNRAKYRGWLE